MPRKPAVAPRKNLTNQAVARHTPLYYRLHTLLHTLRAIGTFEDQLCTLLQEIKGSSKPSMELQAELRETLADLPVLEYVQEVDALRALLPHQNASGKTRGPQKAAAKKSSRGGAKRN